MPLSGDEEGVKAHAWHSSDSVAGIPIKKRKFLLVRPSSPPPELPSSPQLESHKEQLTANLVSSSSNAGGFPEVSGFVGSSSERSLSEKGEHSAGRDVNLVQNTVEYSDLSRHEQTSPTVFGVKVDSECPLFPGNTELQLASYGHLLVGVEETVIKKEFSTSDKPELSRIPGQSELLLVPKESLRLASPGENSEAACKEQDKPELSRIPGKSELLIPKESLRLASPGENSEAACKEQDKLDPNKWNLGLSKGVYCSNSNDFMSKVNSTQLTNRSHWDLNTMMETWDGSLNDASIAPRTAGVGTLDAAVTNDIKPALGLRMSVSEPEGTHVGVGKEILHKSEHSSKPTLVDQQYRSDHLLCPLVPQSGLSLELSSFPREVDSRRMTSNLRLPSELVDHKIVKSEPSDEGNRLDFIAKVDHPKLVERGIVKSEPLQGCSEEPQKLSNFSKMKPVDRRAVNPEELQKLSNISHMKSVDQRAVKPEPVEGGRVENPKSVEKLSMQSGIQSQNSGVPTSLGGRTHDMGMPVTNEVSQPFELPTTELSISGKVSDQSLVPIAAKMPTVGQVGQGASTSDSIVSSGLVAKLVNPDGKEQNVSDDMLDLPRKECVDAANPDKSRLNLIEEPNVDALGNGEVSENNEKINISADEEFSYDTDSESDGNHATGGVMDTEDKARCDEDDYEDGEVREASVPIATDGGLCAEGEAEQAGDTIIPISAFPSEYPGTTSDVLDRDPKIEETENSECTGQQNSLDKKDDQGYNEVACVQESFPVELKASEIEEKPITAVAPLDQTDIDQQRSDIVSLASDTVTSITKGPDTSDGKDEGANLQEDVHGTNSLGASSVLSKTEACVNGEETAKDVNGRGNRSRIIYLPRASNVSSSAGTKPIQGRVLPSQSQGERFSDVVHRGDKLLARGSREGRYMDPKFERKRNRDQPFGSTGSEFRLGRGRADNRLRSIRGEWDSSVHDFSPDECNGPTGFRFLRSKNAASAKECSDFSVARGGRTIGNGRGGGGRKSLDDELPNFRHPPSRRRSPGGREGPVSRGVQIVRRPPRDISPDRCITEDDPSLIGLRHEEKFMRGLPGEVMSTVFPRSQPQYERLDDSFVRGDTSFSPMHRRVPLHMPQVHSKSPPRSRTRSPGPWTSPRRRSPDGFVGHQELTHCRSPRIYRMERMRSPPQHPCFAEDMVVRRHDSPPPFMSRLCNDMRDIGSSREHDHPRSFIRSRSPSGRILPRSTRRFEMVDPRERTESDELFAEAMHSGRFHELVGDGADEGRRKCIERRGPVRSFRPPYNGSDVVNFRHHEEDGPRPYRFCPEVGVEFHDRGNLRGRGFERGTLRGRGFDRRMKNRPDNVPRTRNIEEQEENYWHNEQGWQDADFEDVSHMKRRRF